MMGRDEAEVYHPLTVRLPSDIAAWLEDEAARNDRSRNSEVIRTLRIRMTNEPKKATG
jgi:Arc/MetJ-type ribon-helix-helix transcriptional regulator